MPRRSPSTIGLSTLVVEGRHRTPYTDPPRPMPRDDEDEVFVDDGENVVGYSRGKYRASTFEDARATALHRYEHDFEGVEETMKTLPYFVEMVKRGPGFIPYDSQDGIYRTRGPLRQRAYVSGFILRKHMRRFTNFINANSSIVAQSVAALSDAEDDTVYADGRVIVSVEGERVPTSTFTSLNVKHFEFSLEHEGYISPSLIGSVSMVNVFDPLYGRKAADKGGLFEVVLAALDACSEEHLADYIPLWEVAPSHIEGVHQYELDELLERAPHFFLYPHKSDIAHLPPTIQERLLNAADEMRSSLDLITYYYRKHGIDITRDFNKYDDADVLDHLLATFGDKRVPILLRVAILNADFSFLSLMR